MSTLQWFCFWIYAIPAGFGLLAACMAGLMAMGFAQDYKKKGIEFLAEGFKVWALVSLAAIVWPVYVPAEIYKEHS